MSKFSASKPTSLLKIFFPDLINSCSSSIRSNFRSTAESFSRFAFKFESATVPSKTAITCPFNTDAPLLTRRLLMTELFVACTSILGTVVKNFPEARTVVSIEKILKKIIADIKPRDTVAPANITDFVGLASYI